MRFSPQALRNSDVTLAHSLGCCNRILSRASRACISEALLAFQMPAVEKFHWSLPKPANAVPRNRHTRSPRASSSTARAPCQKSKR
jgi:hypothetical protein